MAAAKPSPSLLELARIRRPGAADSELIAEIAAHQIAELDLRPPIPLEIVASFRDITDIEVVAMEQSGSLAPGPESLRMRLRAADSPRRRRFTGFHEVVHTYQPGYRELTLFRCNSPVPRRTESDPEALSDIGACELLLPRRDFEPATLGSGFAIGDVTCLAHEYEASLEATSYRFARFWPEPTLVVILQPGLRKDELDDPEAVERLRVVSRWAEPRQAWPFVPTNKSAREGGYLDGMATGDVIAEKVGLEEFGLEMSGSTELVAGAFAYGLGAGKKERVVAIFRRLGEDRG
jgi:hypothetical protein